MQGYIKLYRQIQDCWIWCDGERYDKRSAWIDLLLHANHRDKKLLFDGDLITIKRGQYLTSLHKLADRWGWSINTVKKYLDLLENDGMIQRKSNNRCTVIDILNYENFQGFQEDEKKQCDTVLDTVSDTVSDIHRAQSLTPNKNDKECIKNEKNNKRYADDDSLNDALKDFIEHRKKLKKPMTDRAVELLKNKLDNLAPANINKQIQLINTAIEKGWQSVYPEKESSEQIIQHDDPYANLRELERRYLE